MNVYFAELDGDHQTKVVRLTEHNAEVAAYCAETEAYRLAMGKVVARYVKEIVELKTAHEEALRLTREKGEGDVRELKYRLKGILARIESDQFPASMSLRGFFEKYGVLP